MSLFVRFAGVMARLGRRGIFGGALAMAVAVAGMAPVAVAQQAAPEQVAAYADVAADTYYYEAVNSLAAAGVYAGTDCAPNQLCPSQPLKRWEMAVWLVRALDGTEPAPAGAGRFTDVEADEWWLPYVERLADLEITGGCRLQPLRYCPDRAVTRAEMATFLTRAFDLPPADPAGFTDVADGNVHRDNINRLAAAKITGGCRLEPLQYCPQQPVSRAQMSVFIHRGLQWQADNETTETRRGSPTPVLISNDTDEFITEENDFSRYILHNIVEKHEAHQPWLRAVWNHTNRADFTYLSADGHGTAVYYGNRMGEGDVIPRSTAVAMTAHPSQLSWVYDSLACPRVGPRVHQVEPDCRRSGPDRCRPPLLLGAGSGWGAPVLPNPRAVRRDRRSPDLQPLRNPKELGQVPDRPRQAHRRGHRGRPPSLQRPDARLVL